MSFSSYEKDIEKTVFPTAFFYMFTYGTSKKSIQFHEQIKFYEQV